MRIPKEIHLAYGISSDAIVRPMKGGMINSTYLIRDKKAGRFILQRLSDIFSEEMAYDTKVVFDYLRSEGWEVPATVYTLDKQLSTTDKQGSVWRAVTFIPSDARVPETLERGLVHDIGRITGELHAALAGLDYEPKFELLHYHDFWYYENRLDDVSPRLSPQLQRQAKVCLERYQTLPALVDNVQLVHGDMRVENILFRDKMPFVFIDYDTLMKDSVWADIGDLIRSLVEDTLTSDKELPMGWLESFAEGYLKSNEVQPDIDGFVSMALDAAKVLTLSLEMRFLIDVVEDRYFDWDKTVFKSRRDSNLMRAQHKVQTFEILSEYHKQPAAALRGSK